MDSEQDSNLCIQFPQMEPVTLRPQIRQTWNNVYHLEQFEAES